MADKVSYPQIPGTVWWGVRAILQRTPGATIDERLLGVQLGVQEAAAKQYIAELRRVGILSDENKATPIAQKWRLDDSYLEAVDRILAAAYPEGLLHVAPPGDADRQKVVSWFQREGLGNGAAGNKAATYLLIGSRDPNTPPSRGNTKSKSEEAPKRPAIDRQAANEVSKASTPKNSNPKLDENQRPKVNIRTDSVPLNINIQIHISADAGTDQIESIFSAMKRYLNDDQHS